MFALHTMLSIHIFSCNGHIYQSTRGSKEEEYAITKIGPVASYAGLPGHAGA